MSRETEPYERNTIASRAQDLAANDPHVANITDSMEHCGDGFKASVPAQLEAFRME